MSVSHACKVKYGSAHLIQIEFCSLMRLTIVYVCAKFHTNRFNSKKKVVTDPICVGGTSAGVAIMPGLGGQTVVGCLSVVLKCAHLRPGAPRTYPILSYPRRRYVGGGGDNGNIKLSLPVIIVYD